MKTFEYYKNKKCENLLIHGNDIVLIDRVIECQQDFIIVNANLREDLPYLDTYNGKKVFRTYKGIEMMAQSLGCLYYINMAILGDERAKIGFILGSRKFEIFIPYVEYNKELFIETRLSVQNNDGFGVYDSTIYAGEINDENIIARANLSVLSPPDNFIEELQNSEQNI